MRNPGSLDKVIDFYYVPDGDDWDIDMEPTLAVEGIWASIKHASARQYWEAKSAKVEISHTIVIRYREDIDDSMVIKYNGRTFKIKYMYDEDEEQKYIVIMANEEKKRLKRV